MWTGGSDKFYLPLCPTKIIKLEIASCIYFASQLFTIWCFLWIREIYISQKKIRIGVRKEKSGRLVGTSYGSPFLSATSITYDIFFSINLFYQFIKLLTTIFSSTFVKSQSIFKHEASLYSQWEGFQNDDSQVGYLHLKF